MRLIATRKDHQNGAAVDPWTAVHMAMGLAAGLMRLPVTPSIAAAVAYEVAEQMAERADVGQELFETSGPESLPNAIVDVLVFAVGYRLGDLWNRTGR